MYSIQKGALPNVTGIVSLALPIWVLMINLKYLIENVDTRIPEIIGDSTKPIWSVVLAVMFFTLFFPVYIGILLASIFPTIEVRRDGLGFRYWGFLGSKLKWEDIESLVYYPNGYIVLRIDKRGLPILNGLYFNSLQAKFVKSHLPILVFSPGLERREEIIAVILDKCSPRVIRRK